MLRATHCVRFLSGVNAQVALQGLQVAEAGSAGVAGVWLLSGVDQNMGPQVSNLTPGQTHCKDMTRLEEVDIWLRAVWNSTAPTSHSQNVSAL